MVGPEGRSLRRRAPYLGVLAGLLLTVGSLVVPMAVGAQDAGPVVAPGYCSPLGDLLDAAYQVPVVVIDEGGEQPLDALVRLLDELQQVAPSELAADLDALEAFTTEAAAEITAAGGIDGLPDAQLEDLGDSLFTLLDPVAEFYGQSCPGANVYAVLYPECDVEGEVYPPELDVDNSSDEPVEVTAGDDVFIVDADDFDSREVSADLQADDVLIDGVSGLVEVGSCDDLGGGPSSGFAGLFTVTFVPGCPDAVPPTLPRLTIGLTPEGQASLDGEELEFDEEPFPIPFEVDDFTVIARFPGGLNLLLDADATVPKVSFLDTELTVETAKAECAPMPTTAPNGQSSPQVEGTAAPLSPKFTG